MFLSIRPSPSVLAALPCLLLAGCGASSSAPSHVFFGAYFPSWLLFALLWTLLAAAVRVAMVVAGGAGWPWPLALCTAAGFLLALGLWLLATGGLP